MAHRLYKNRFANQDQSIGQQQNNTNLPPQQFNDQQQGNNNTPFQNNNVQQQQQNQNFQNQPQQFQNNQPQQFQNDQNQQFQQQNTQQQQQQYQQGNNYQHQNVNQQQQQQQYNNNQQHYNQQQPHQNMQSQGQGRPKQQLKRNASQKIDTEQIPRPTTTKEQSALFQEFKTEPGYTNPPQSHQFFTTIDQGNAGPRFMRPTVNAIAKDPQILNSCQIPQGVIITPMAELTQFEEQVPVVDCTETQIQRCQRCKAYINPNWQYQDNGNVSQCNICKMTQKVPNDYYCPLNEFRARSDRNDRPELSKGVYDILAPKEYLNKKCKSICVMVCLEMTPAALQSGVYAQALGSIQSLLDYVPAPEQTNIAICTFDKVITFYNVPKNLDNDPALILVSDLDDPYCPVSQEALYMNIQNDKEKINYLIEKLLKNGEQLQQQYLETKVTYIQSPSVGAIVKSISESMEESVGRIIVFSSQHPQIGYGSLKKREESKLMNTENEKQLYQPQGTQYTELARELLKKRIGVDLFIFSQACDLATISTLVTLTGGSLYHYPEYDPNTDGERIHYDLFRNFTRTYAYDCMMTLRTSPGVILHDYFTQVGKQTLRDLELSCIDSDKTLAIAFKQEDKIQDQEAYLQFAILYTNQFCQRVIRVINVTLQVTDNQNNIFRSADIDATTTLMFRRIASQLPTHSIKIMKDQMQNKTVSILHAYRITCAASSSPGQLILPESLKMLGLFVNSLFKQELLRQGGQIKTDYRIADYIKINSLPPQQLLSWLYPKIYPIHTIYENGEDDENCAGNQIQEGQTIIPSTVSASSEKIDDDGVYLVASDDIIYLYIGQECNPELLLHLFETSDISEISQMLTLPVLDTDYNIRVQAILDQIRRNKMGSYQGVKIAIMGDYLEAQVRHQLVEDNIRGIEPYADFLCNLHKLIQQKQSQ